MIRILVADDHEILRWGLVKSLSRQPDLAVVGEVGDTEAAVEATGMLAPDVLLLDLSMPGGGGWCVLERVLARDPAQRVVIHSATDDVVTVETALARGARAHVSKSAEAALLVDVVRAVAGDHPLPVAADHLLPVAGDHPLLRAGDHPLQVAADPLPVGAGASADGSGGPQAARSPGGGDPGAG